MNKILCHILPLSFLFSVHLFWPLPDIFELTNAPDEATSFYEQSVDESLLDATMVCNRTADSLVLIDLYNATGSNLNWFLFMPMDNWPGVTLNASGCVTMLELSNTGLTGTLPASIGNLEALQLLHLDNNSLSGSIPPEIGNLSNLTILFLDNNAFSGSIPESIGNMPVLNTIFLDNNCFSGQIPASFSNLSNLLYFDFFYNKIDGLPDLSALPVLPGKFRVHNNQLTFDDILPNIFELQDDYEPQDSFFVTSSYTAYTGEYFEVDLEIDADITTNQYVWYKNGAYHSTTNSNKLVFDPVGWDVAGSYNCVVTNPGAPLLTLYSRYIYINVECGQSVFDLAGTYCNDQDFLVNGVTYNAGNPTGTELLSGQDVYGCDSIVNINLVFQASTTGFLDTTLCQGGSLFYNGVTYNAANDSGSALLPNGNVNGCDSIVEISLSFYPPAEGFSNEVLCPNDFIVVNGTIYNISNPTGTENMVLPNGCDSMHQVNLSFYPPAINNFNEELCAGQEITINNTVYNEGNPTGEEVLENASYHGCDSTVFINLTFSPALTGTVDTMLCNGDFIVVNGTTYNLGNPTGEELLENASPSGCDSIVSITVNYFPPAVANINDVICEYESLVINGTTYDINNPSGIESLTASNSCDSTIFINLGFHPVVAEDFSPAICQNDAVFVNGTEYNFSNPTGTEIIPGIGQGNCDSTINVALQFYPVAENFINENYCNGQSIVVNNVTYDQNNPTGTELLAGQSYHGCDSTVYINLAFSAAPPNNYFPVICEGENIVINNTVYDANNLTGTEIIYGVGQNGCDSTVNVSLAFYPAAVYNIDTTLCPGETILVNNVEHGASNPEQTYFLSGASQNGCDSIINIDLQFFPVAENFINETLCNGQSISVNGTTYDQGNPTGTEVLTGQSFHGCDSTIYINLEFSSGLFTTLDDTLCPGESIVVNNTIYDATNPEGVEVFWSGSQAGCDSTVTIDLSFYEPIVSDFSPELCEGEAVVVNGNVYNAGNLTGTETLPGASATGCDSTVNISLTYITPPVGLLDTTVCENAEIFINGELFNFANSSGTQILEGMSYQNCDSTLNVQLYFFTPETGTLDTTICAGDVFVYNNTTYSVDNTSGQETLQNASVNLCDSIVQVTVNFFPPAEHTISQTLCFGQKITVNEVCYDADNPTGMEVLPGASQHGCDSTIFINLDFSNASIFPLNDLLCFDESVEVNGTVYDISNPTGTELFEGGSAAGCDSIVEVNLQFFTPSPNTINPVLCPGENYEYNGVTYDENNSVDTVLLMGAGYVGCDSTVIINLQYLANASAEVVLSLCPGESYELNNTIYDATNPNGQEILIDQASNGCDSIVDVFLNFYPAVESNYETTLCFGDTLFINGTAYHAANTSGTEVFENATANQCDSTVFVNIIPLPANITNINQTLCDGQSIVVNGVTYDEDNLTGTEILVDTNNCDSIVNIALEYSNEVIVNITETLCPGENMLVNDVLYDEENPTGTETILMGSTSGCDSSIVVNLSFYYPENTLLDQTLCPGESVVVNGMQYDEFNPSGTETLEGQALFGCDSTVVIDLSFYEIITTTIDLELCPGDSIEIDGITYDETSSSEEYTLVSSDGCDSIVVVNVVHLENSIYNINDILCFGQSIEVNGTTYDETNPAGIEIMEDAAANGCDSIINVSLDFNAFSQYNFVETFCEDEEIEINGTLYNITNTNGTDTLPGASSAGCDSIIFVELTFLNFTYHDITETLCPEDSIVVNGQTYNNMLPSGEETLTGQNGCDSIVTINLSFYAPAILNYTDELCIGESVVFNGVVYNYENQSGTEFLPGASSNMCDSTIQVNLTFLENGTNQFQPTLCHGDSVVVNGNTYNATTPEGEEILIGQSATGCDSIVIISLDFYDAATYNYTEQLCFGESVTINGTIYNEALPSGTEVIPGGSYQGCDSTIYVNLVFGNAAISEMQASICSGQSYELNGESFAETGMYEISLPGQGSGGCDSIIRLDLTVIEVGDLPAAIAGSDKTICEDHLVLSAGTPEGVEGLWTIVSGTAVLENPELPAASLSNIDEDVDLVLSWTLSTDLCPNYDSDSISIHIMDGPVAVNDDFDFDSNLDPVFSFNVLANDEIPAEEPFSFEMITEPEKGNLEAMGDGLYNFTIVETFGGNIGFSYKICLDDCPDLCSEATVNLLITPVDSQIDTTVNIPNAFTPNDDGVNDTFVIDDLETRPEDFEDNEFIVFNRWGDIVYRAKPYLNDWDGTGLSGKPLQTGTYYYILNLDLANGVVYRGDVTLLR